MKNVKRLPVIMLVVMAVFLGSVLYVSAANAGLSGYTGNGETVLIRVLSAAGDESDFVVNFPGKLSLGKDATEPPVEEPTEAVQANYRDVPPYWQSDYPDSLYGTGTVETCGSSITSLAMVATYLTGYDYRPNELARWFAGKADDDNARLAYAADALDIPYTKSQTWSDVMSALENGKVVLLELNATSVLADDRHYIVLRGLNEVEVKQETGETEEQNDGAAAVEKETRILIHDPNLDNYLNEDLTGYFTTGFPVNVIETGAKTGWIFDKKDVSATVSRYDETVRKRTYARYSTLKLTPAEKQLLARAVAVLAPGECAEGQQAVVEVILNRMLSDQYPNELKELIYGEDGLTEAALLNEVELSRNHYLAVEWAVQGGPYLVKKGVTEFSYVCHK